jgi:hypothetical protein
LNDRSFRFASAFSLSKERRGVTFRDNLRLISEDFEPLNLDRLTREIIRPVQDLVSFATNTANSILHFAVWNKSIDVREERTRFSVFREQIIDPQEDLGRLDRDEMLFSYVDTIDSGFELFDAWGQFRSRFQTFCMVYFAHQSAPLTFQEDKFVRIFHDLQLFFRLAGLPASQAYDAQQWIDSLPPDSTPSAHRQWLAAVIPDKSDLSLPWNVLHALEDNAAIIKPLMNKEPGAFVDEVLDALVCILRREKQEEPATRWGERLYFLIEQLSILLKVCILRRVGFEREWIRRVVAQNKRINFLKTVSD